jgi:hypothetical protein
MPNNSNHDTKVPDRVAPARVVCGPVVTIGAAADVVLANLRARMDAANVSQPGDGYGSPSAKRGSA